MFNQQPVLHCEWDICGKRLKEFCFRCADNDKLYCDDICSARDQLDRRSAPVAQRVH
jgi:hypothetical protein